VKVLLVEDNKVHTLILSMILRSFHVEITVAENGKEGVDLFLEGKKFDIVFCDNEMPVMAGPEVF
jgi:CheY-like chemotaxis protein